MANKLAQITFNLTYSDENGSYYSIPGQTVQAQYQAQTHGTIDVPDAETSATSHAVPFGGIGVDATAGLIINQTGQPLEVHINGAMTASHTLPTGGAFAWGHPNTPGGSGGGQPTPITSLSLKTTAMQSGAGYINFHLFGDPV